MKIMKKENGLTSTMKNDPPYPPHAASISHIKVLNYNEKTDMVTLIQYEEFISIMMHCTLTEEQKPKNK